MFHFYLTPYIDSFNFLNLFNYLTFRAGGALFTAFFISLFLGPKFIKKLKVFKKWTAHKRRWAKKSFNYKSWNPNYGRNANFNFIIYFSNFMD